MTNHWVDIKNANVIIVMGGNAAEAHPCGFKWVTEAKAHNHAKFIVIDPRFTRSAAVADLYAPIRTGTDIAFLGGVINYLLSHDKIQHEYVKAYTNATFIVDEEVQVRNGLFSGYNAANRSYDKSTWAYEIGDGRLLPGWTRPCSIPAACFNDEAALFPLHAGDGEQHLRHAQGSVPQGVRDDRRPPRCPTRP